MKEPGWFLPDSAINDLMQRSFERLWKHAQRAYYTNAVVRKDSVETLYEADWIKHMRRTGDRMTTLDPNRVQICRVAPINYDNGQPCSCPDGTCSLWKAGLRPAARGGDRLD